MSLAPLIAAIARGPSKGRSLTREESAQAMGEILRGEAAPEAIGALFMVLRYRGETADEIAGFVDGMRAQNSAWQEVACDLDWPSYAAGRTRGLPWFLLSARLLAQAGVKVMLHGWNSHQASRANLRDALPYAGISTGGNLTEVNAVLERDNIVYAALETLDKNLLNLLKLRDVLGLRSPVNTSLRAFNPTGAKAAVQGVFHPAYRGLQQDAARILGQQNLAVLKGGGGEFERLPGKDVEVFGLSNGQAFDTTLPAVSKVKRRLSEIGEQPQDLSEFWTGRADFDGAEAVICGTAALALQVCGRAKKPEEALQLAQDLWCNRPRAF